MNSKEQILKLLESRIETMQKLAIEGIELIWIAAYNEAIEQAADVVNSELGLNGGYIEKSIRSLKK